jgi:hypothetical protein
VTARAVAPICYSDDMTTSRWLTLLCEAFWIPSLRTIPRPQNGSVAKHQVETAMMDLIERLLAYGAPLDLMRETIAEIERLRAEVERLREENATLKATYEPSN